MNRFRISMRHFATKGVFKVRVGILDIDTKKEKLANEKYGKFPNIACGKIYGFHKMQGDEIFYPYAGQKVDKLYISVIFSWSKPRVERLIEAYSNVATEIIVGGTGWDWRVKLPEEIERVDPRWTYELYDIDYGIGFTSRGCHVGCSFCVVSRKEGAKEYRDLTVEQIINPRSNHIVLLNNNSFADAGFFDDVEVIKSKGLTVNWNQANDITLINSDIAAALSSVEYRNFAKTSKTLHFACDQMIKRKRDAKTGEWVSFDMLKTVPEKVAILQDAGIRPSHLTFYMLIGFDTTLEQDMQRFSMLNDLGCNVYAMMFRDLTGKINVDGKGNQQGIWVKPLRDWINGHAFRNVKFDEFDRYVKAIEKSKQLTIFDGGEN